MPFSRTHGARHTAGGTQAAVLLMAMALAACAAPGTFIAGEPLTGEWGGEHIALSLSTSGGSVEYDCAHGGLTEPIRLDTRGAFHAAGVHMREHGGPARVDERPDSIPARYVGQVSGNRMNLSVLTATDTLGPFALGRNAAPRLLKCL